MVERNMSQNLDVRVAQGIARGVRERGIEAWRNLPYAEAPIGPLRFKAPRPPVPWAGVRDASEFGPVPWQSLQGHFVGASKKQTMSEDCLTLNVLRPAGSVGGGLPVMLFIHGGAYAVGSSAEYPRNGEALVRDGGIVYVSINYRLSALGYLDFTRFSTPERAFDSNLGLRDQVAALEWVRANIAAFGGDPNNVTVFGESAGGNAVTTLMATPAAHGLFAKAIAQSAPTNAIYPPEQTHRWADEFVAFLADRIEPGGVETTSVDDAGDLLARADASDLVEAAVSLTLLAPDRDPGTIALCPVIDGDFLPERPLKAFKHGRAARIPLIIGTNDREGSLFTGRLDILATTPPRIRAIFSRTKKKARKAIKAEYPGLPDKRPAADFAGDYAFWYPTVKVAERHSRYAPVHFYRFDIAPRLVRQLGFDATHGLELFALFDRMNGWFGRAMGALGGRRAFMRTGDRMRRHWIDFARSGQVAGWPEYDEETRATMIFDKTDRVENDPRSARRVAWQEFVPHV
ncbi:carboxylesterase/lipase family protein [Agreia pratensis]|nr:carboxylesterase/lipase family protein [Agreia pratensis]